MRSGSGTAASSVHRYWRFAAIVRITYGTGQEWLEPAIVIVVAALR
jgi:hypothetical protein